MLAVNSGKTVNGQRIRSWQAPLPQKNSFWLQKEVVKHRVSGKNTGANPLPNIGSNSPSAKPLVHSGPPASCWCMKPRCPYAKSWAHGYKMDRSEPSWTIWVSQFSWSVRTSSWTHESQAKQAGTWQTDAFPAFHDSCFALKGQSGRICAKASQVLIQITSTLEMTIF